MAKGKGKGSHPNSLAALEKFHWKPGQSGNPNGRAKGSRNIKERVAFYLEKKSHIIDDETGEPLNAFDAGIVKMIAQYITGDKDARRELFDRLEGKPAQSVTVTEPKPDALEYLDEQELLEEAERLQEEIASRANTKSTETEENQADAGSPESPQSDS